MLTKRRLVVQFIILIVICDFALGYTSDNYPTTQISSSECYDAYGKPRRCIPEFENAAFGLTIEATNTCGVEEDTDFCVQTGYSNRKSCDVCRPDDHRSEFLTDLHDPKNPTWWQSETIYEGIQFPTIVNLTLNLGKSFDITYIRIVFYSPRPESFSIFKRVTEDGPWIPYQYYSATCRSTYSLPDSLSIQKGEDESRALCTSEYSDISPLMFGNIAFSSLEGRPSAYNFEHSIELQQWVTATDIKISLNRLNTFGDELFGDKQVLKSYFYAIADIAVGARCKCNGHANKCVESTGLNGERKKVCECKHFTDGPDCDKCLPFYNDAPWGRATSKTAHECKQCTCNGYSTKCYFDRSLYNLTGHGGHCIDCTSNRDGANCERCKDNFFMREDGYCTNCGCNPTGSRSLQCNSEGKCQCKPGVGGDKCDRCETNHYNFGSHGCHPCNCDGRGSFDNAPSCDPETGLCLCKENVEGRHCRECKPGFFNLDQENKFGCTPCFCYGHTSECQSASGYSIVSTTSNFNKHKEKWSALDNRNRVIDLKYSQPRQSIGVINQGGNDFIYFLAPDRFLGDQRASYNKFMKFKLQLSKQRGPNPSPLDIILEGAGTQISLPIFAQGQGLPEDQIKEYSFRLHENFDYSWQPSQSSRGFMSILSNLTAIKIRASFAESGEAYLDDFELQTAHRGAAGYPATWIEQCACPEGYVGQFCESCAPGYRHSPANGGPFMPCIPCNCNKHAEICDSETGRCICQHNTAGDTCDQCARGYYGNALSGTPYDCKRCPCPDGGSCLQLPDDSVICLECPTGYFGSRCEICSDGYYGDPTGISGKVQLCQTCDCNGNIDPNAVGNCNRTTGECLKCIHNTDGAHCNVCLPGHFGDPYGSPHGQCEACSCYPRGTEQTQDGISICDQISGNCNCKPNVVGKNCNECQNGFWNIASSDGCENCKCDTVGSYNSSCNTYTGQCFCKPGVTGLRCETCEAFQYGFSNEGCKACDCDSSGSKSSQCDENGQCLCNENVEGRTCNRCKENKYDRHQGCLDCAPCYNLVQDAVNNHRGKLTDYEKILEEIAMNPTVIEDGEFESKLKALNEKVDIVLEDAKSGTGGGERSLIQKLDDLREQLSAVGNTLYDSESLQNNAKYDVARANQSLIEAQITIQEASKELNIAVDSLQTEGVSELLRAKNKSNQFEVQSEQMSDISRNARALADNLGVMAKQGRDDAQNSKQKAINSSEIAKKTMDTQRTITDDLKFTLAVDFNKEMKKLESLKGLTTSALEKANNVYDEALTLFANINAISIPEIKVAPLKKDSAKLVTATAEMSDELQDILNRNDELLHELDENIQFAEVLLDRAETQKEEALVSLDNVNYSKNLAEKAVEEGDDTLGKANSTYHVLQSFKSQVQESSESAKVALTTVPAIIQQIKNTEEIVAKAEEALEGAHFNAKEARANAQEAQEKFADQASKDADFIRRKANEAKNEAQKLYFEADNLRTRVTTTESRFGSLEDLAGKDDKLTDSAKEMVGQAKADSSEALKQLEKALIEVKSITSELEDMKEISINDLDILERRLNNTESELESANLNRRLESLRDLKNHQNRFMKDFSSEIEKLENEVVNVRAISNALPNGCFKRTRLEP